MYAQFSRHKILVHLELLYEPGFKSFPALRTHEMVEVLFLKRYGFDISLYQALWQRWGVNFWISKLAALIWVAALNPSFTVLVVKHGFTWTLTKVFPNCERWRVACYNGKFPLRFLHTNFFLWRHWEKKKALPTKNKKFQSRIEPGSKYLHDSLTTTLPRQHNRNWKKFNYTNTIKHIFVIKSVTGVFF